MFRQAMEILEKEFSYNVVYVNPLAERVEEVLRFTPSIKDIVKEVLKLFPDSYSKIVDVAISIAYRVIKRFSKPRVAVLMDDIFQAIGLDRAKTYVKTLLNLIEYPPASYERIAVLVSSSEGITQERIGRHSWAEIFVLWNMGRREFEKLYEELPERGIDFDKVWRFVGGNPRYLERLFKAKWRVGKVIDDLVEDRRILELIHSLSSTEKQVLKEAIENPDILLERYGEVKNLVYRLIERNLIIRLKRRSPDVWFDVPPPEKDLELGIGRYYAWQTPIHKEAVRKAMEHYLH